MLSARHLLVEPTAWIGAIVGAIASQAIQERLFGHPSPNYRVPPGGSERRMAQDSWVGTRSLQLTC